MRVARTMDGMVTRAPRLRPAAVLLTAAFACAGLAAGCSKPADTVRRVAPVAAVDPARAGVVSGRIPDPVEGTIVVLMPAQPEAQPAPGPADAPPVMDQVQMTFVPNLLIAQAGFPVSFHSSDSELHNINVQTIGQRFSEFNRSLPPGVSFDHTFKTPGFYSVRCDIHPEMTAEIFVAASPFATTIGADGAFVFTAVPPGTYALTVYAGAARTEKTIEVTAGANEVRFDAP
jgi:plastocyanin